MALPANGSIKDGKGAQVMFYVWRESDGTLPETMTYLSMEKWPETHVGETFFSPAILGTELVVPADGKVSIPIVRYGDLLIMTIYVLDSRIYVNFWITQKEIELVSHCISVDCSNPAEAICGVCKTAPYCSVKCQKRDWERHRKECRSE